MAKISKDMKLSEIISKYPDTSEIFLKHGLSCIGCPLASQETLEQGAKAHGIDVDKLIKALNECLEKNE